MIRNRYIAIMSALLAVSFTACEVETDEEPGGTVMQEMAGKWLKTCLMLQFFCIYGIFLYQAFLLDLEKPW